jgi:hypothetical protein
MRILTGRELAARLIRAQFGVAPFIQTGYGRCGSTRTSSKRFIEWLDAVEAGRTAYEKRIPPIVTRAARRTVLALLSGLALDAYTTVGQSLARWAICVASPGLLDDLQILLTRLGIVHGRRAKWNSTYERYYDEVNVSGKHAQAMVRVVLCLESHRCPVSSSRFGRSSSSTRGSTCHRPTRSSARTRRDAHRAGQEAREVP